MTPRTIPYQSTSDNQNSYNSYNQNSYKCDKLCKEIACVVGPITCTCSFFLIWFFHEINVEFHSNNSLN